MANERSLVCAADEVRRLLAGEAVEIRRPMKPQPPSIDDVRAMSGSDYGIFTDGHSPGVFRVAGPVWAVRELLGHEQWWTCPFGTAGEQRWIKETWAIRAGVARHTPVAIAYRADGERCWRWHQTTRPMAAVTYAGEAGAFQWRSSIHMPRWGSRLVVTIDAVRCERGAGGAWEWVLVAKRSEVRDG